MNWYPEAEALLLQGNYQKLAAFYEEKIENNPDNIDNYWYLGLAYLLLEKEEEAQTTWFFPMGFAGEEELEIWTENLVNILETEAVRQETINNEKFSWLIRGHIREISVNNLTNLLRYLLLTINLGYFDSNNTDLSELISILENNELSSNTNLLSQFLSKILPLLEGEIGVKLAAICLRKTSDFNPLIDGVMNAVNIITDAQQLRVYYAIELIKLCLELKPNNPDLLYQLYYYYKRVDNFNLSLELITKIKEIKQNSTQYDQLVFDEYHYLSTLNQMGKWSEFAEGFNHYKSLLIKAFNLKQNSLFLESRLTMPFLYLQDNPEENRWFQNNISQIACSTWRNSLKNYDFPFLLSKNQSEKPLKIGYLGSTFRRHSVGWLCRWLFYYADQEKYPISIYSLKQEENEFTQNWFINRVKNFYSLPDNPELIADKIYEDQIDILIDLDSLTGNVTCQVLALKPAPIQATWLGLDATGLPTVDYFIADNYVLPENADNYYQEKIWRLPQTYLAINGFEVATPTLKREDLDIPSDAIIYFSSQVAMKRNPNTIRMQLKIIKAVANSYLLIKGLGDDLSIQELFTKLAAEEGVSEDRLRFLPGVPNEEIHRANLQELADIVLDTYPYSGATNTLENLWLNIPMVTRVGQQWAARNSYAFMMNAGITEGIAWNDQEYIDWGIRLGKDEDLRAKIAWKLRQSKKTAPLWNSKKFTQEMENAYQQMWQIYINK